MPKRAKWDGEMAHESRPRAPYIRALRSRASWLPAGLHRPVGMERSGRRRQVRRFWDEGATRRARSPNPVTVCPKKPALFPVRGGRLPEGRQDHTCAAPVWGRLPRPSPSQYRTWDIGGGDHRAARRGRPKRPCVCGRPASESAPPGNGGIHLYPTAGHRPERQLHPRTCRVLCRCSPCT